MATRNLTMVIPSARYKQGYRNYEDYSYVNMYLHHDGYPMWQGVQLANWLKANPFQDESKLAAKLVYDMYYDSCYLYDKASSIDHQYTYMVFVGKDTRIVCHDNYSDEEVFDMTPDEVLAKYTDDMDYTRFDKGQTRYMQGQSDDVKYHSNKLLEILQKF